MILNIQAPAKINLWLEVIRKREDGYHDLSSLMLPVSVFDQVSLRIRPEGGPVTLSCGSPEAPSDERNLAWKAADLFRSTSGIDAGIHIDLEKRIPSGAGLGGGSSDAGSILAALNAHFGKPIADKELEKLACGIGADVPFFLHSRPALATGIGERLEFAGGVPAFPLLLIKPPINVPTAWVYRNLKLTRGLPQITLSDLNAQPLRFEDFIANDLESVTVSAHPVIAELKDWLLGHGALAASMSGSGPTVFGIFPSNGAALSAGTLANEVWRDCWVRAAEVIGT